MMQRVEANASFRPPSMLRVGLALLAAAYGVQAQFYAVTDLGTLGGTSAMAYSINNQEQVAGAAETTTGSFHAFLFDGGRMVDVGTLGGGNSWAYGINDGGWMVGAAELASTHRHAFLCTNTLLNPLMMDLGTLSGTNSAAWMINGRGDIVGWAAMSNGNHHAFFMTNGMPFHMMDLGAAGGKDAAAYCINTNRMAVGYAIEPDGTLEPIMSTNAMFGGASMMVMGMGGMGAAGGQYWFVNDRGQAVGQVQMSGGNSHALVSSDGGMMGRLNVDLGGLGGTNAIAYCINNAGTVVGTAGTGSGMPHAFMVTNALGGMARMMDLNDLIPTNSGWELLQARAVNASGQVVGWGRHHGRTNAFLLTPVSAPVRMMSPPSSQIVGSGTPVTLDMQMSASEPLTYQWLHDGVAIPHATNAVLTLPSRDMGIAGRYTVSARNAVGTVGSASAVVGMFRVSVTTGTPRLTVAAPSGSRFRIDYSEMVGAGTAWQVMTNFTVMGGASTASDAPSSTSPVRFYRAAMLP